MYILDLFSELLNRDLTREESALINRLTAQGLAKVNHDLCQGMDLEHTLGELRRVYRAMLRRRHEKRDGLNKMAKMAIANLGRSVTTMEMQFVDLHCTPTRFRSPFTKDGFLQKNCDLEDSVLKFQDALITSEQLVHWASEYPSMVFSPLVTVHCPLSVSSGRMLCRAPHRPAIGLNPSFSWFNEIEDESLEVSEDAAMTILRDQSCAALSSVPSVLTASTTTLPSTSITTTSTAAMITNLSAILHHNSADAPRLSCCSTDSATSSTTPTTTTTGLSSPGYLSSCSSIALAAAASGVSAASPMSEFSRGFSFCPAALQPNLSTILTTASEYNHDMDGSSCGRPSFQLTPFAISTEENEVVAADAISLPRHVRFSDELIIFGGPDKTPDGKPFNARNKLASLFSRKVSSLTSKWFSAKSPQPSQ